MSRGWTLRLQKSLEGQVRGQGSIRLAALGVTFPSPHALYAWALTNLLFSACSG